ncbi:MAG: hypothetical protein GQ564_16590 [Bacteroidales bacterium]|nr:hypothetical protein [Bacteroidales bacterium]
MKQIKIILLSVFLFNISVVNLFSQTDQFNTLINELTENIQTVTTSKKTIEQVVKNVKPGVISISVNEIDQKGNREEYIYEFNLADIDPIMVREITEKDKIFVQLITNNNQKLITQYKNGELDTYIKILKISAVDIDNARKIKDQIKNIIPVAKQILDNKFNLNSYEEKLNWLTENVGDVSINDVTYQQLLSKDDLKIAKLNLEATTTTEKSTKTNIYEFNLADINVNSVNFEIKGAVFSVVFEIKGKQKFVKCKEDNTQANYTYKVSIVANSIENASDLRYVLSLIIPEAEKNLKNSLPDISSLNQATELLSKNVINTVIENSTINQSIENACITSLSVLEDDTKKRVDTKYNFNLSDFNHNTLKYKISGKKIFINMQTKGANKLIKVIENDVQKNYTDKLDILCDDYENARLLMHLLKKAIPLCEENIVRVIPESDLNSKVNWLIENTVEIPFEGKTYNQVLERVSEDNNKLRLTLMEITDKKRTEFIYEFNLSDVNPNSVKYDISGIELSINLVTNFNSKVVKVYKDGEIQSYLNSLNIYVPDIETARNFILALKECINENAD